MIKVKVIFLIGVKAAVGKVDSLVSTPTSHQDFERRISAVTLRRSSPWPRSPTRASLEEALLEVPSSLWTDSLDIDVLHVGWCTFLGSASRKPTWPR